MVQVSCVMCRVMYHFTFSCVTSRVMSPVILSWLVVCCVLPGWVIYVSFKHQFGWLKNEGGRWWLSDVFLSVFLFGLEVGV